jgi:hypothetical protein
LGLAPDGEWALGPHAAAAAITIRVSYA